MKTTYEVYCVDNEYAPQVFVCCEGPHYRALVDVFEYMRYSHRLVLYSHDKVGWITQDGRNPADVMGRDAVSVVSQIQDIALKLKTNEQIFAERVERKWIKYVSFLID